MNPDLLAAIVAFLRTQGAIVTAFGDSTSSPHFWADYAGDVVPALPYLVLAEPRDTLQFETIDPNQKIGPTSDGVVQLQVFAPSKTSARSLAQQVETSLVDPALSIQNMGVIYFRPTGHQFPLITNIGPDGQPASYSRIVQFRFILEPQ